MSNESPYNKMVDWTVQQWKQERCPNQDELGLGEVI